MPVSHVYVGDGAGPGHLLVYAPGPGPGAPTLSVTLNDSPFGVAANSRGEVIVTLFHSSTIKVYAPGGASVLRTITSGLFMPFGVAVDAQDNFYVANHGAGQAEITKYADGGSAPTAHLLVPLPYNPVGVTVNNDGDVICSAAGNGSFVLRFKNDVYQRILYPLVLASGLASSFRSLFVSDATALSTLAKGQRPFRQDREWIEVARHNYGPGVIPRMLSIDKDSTLYVPVQDPNGSYIDVLPTDAATAPWRITQGLTTPLSAAAA